MPLILDVQFSRNHLGLHLRLVCFHVRQQKVQFTVVLFREFCLNRERLTVISGMEILGTVGPCCYKEL